MTLRLSCAVAVVGALSALVCVGVAPAAAGAKRVPLRVTMTERVWPNTPWSGVRYLRIETIWGPSWPAWREIEVFPAI
ncbi:MAG TPA: hypothetical protein VG144_13785 [Gaiellaceae bacterium]|nr:hypothetical protein [Gaiellaceae bacterium]